MKVISNLATNAVVIAATLTVIAGCRNTPKLDLSGLQELPPSPGGADAEFVEMPMVTPGPEDWQSLDEQLSPGGISSIVPIDDKRWNSVAVYFAYDSAAIGPAERPKLEALAGHMKQHSNYALIIEGHCDQRGSDEYNRALGETRALVVRDYLMTLGIESGRLETISYGEERPVMPNATVEQQFQKNRRAEFILGIHR